jgi:hypothetical protein
LILVHNTLHTSPYKLFRGTPPQYKNKGAKIMMEILSHVLFTTIEITDLLNSVLSKPQKV